MSAYRVCLFNPAGTVAVSEPAATLLEAAKTTLLLVKLAFDEAPAMLDAHGSVKVQVLGDGRRELEPYERDRLGVMLEAFGATSCDDDDDAAAWAFA